MKKIIQTILFLSTISASFAESNLSISNIIVGPQGNEKKTFSITATLDNQGESINNWKFGFYMPRSFRTTSTSNTKLFMQICENSSKKCIPLIYQKPSFDKPDLSTVFTTILAPKSSYVLNANQKYTIKLAHNSSQSSGNISSLPQSFFMIVDEKPVLLPTELSFYKLTNYKESSIQQSIISYQKQKLNNDNGFQESINVIPYPNKVTIINESQKFNIVKNLVLHNNANLPDSQIQFWQDAIKQDFAKNLSIDKQEKKSGIILKTAQFDNPEGYSIIISNDSILISAQNQAGFFYALQTLRQLWFQKKSLIAMEINDAPRFKYRGIQVDVARHFFSIDELKNFIEIMSANKLNTLHLHLSDDEAFRLELEKYPELTKIGASRGLGKQMGPMDMIQSNLFDKTKDVNNAKEQLTNYNGSYSEEDIKELINYANQRQITVIPEIDIPGHSRALMKSLPDIFYDPTDSSEYSGHGDNALPVCAYNNNSKFGKKFTTTLEDILLTVSHQFSNQTTLYAKYGEIGIGGDEVAKRTWSKSPLCNSAKPWNKMDELSKEHYFLDLLNNHHKIAKVPLSGWEEFVLNHDGTIDKNGVKANEIGHVWIWNSYKDANKKAILLANNNYPVVLSYADNLYFDMTYTPELTEPGFYWATKFGDTYAALKSGLNASKTANSSTKPQNIIGLEAGIWTDVIEDYSQLIYMVVPKIAGLSEAAWSNESVTTNNSKINWNSLSNRMGCGNSGFLSYLNKKYNVEYRGYPNGIKLENPDICK